MFVYHFLLSTYFTSYLIHRCDFMLQVYSILIFKLWKTQVNVASKTCQYIISVVSHNFTIIMLLFLKWLPENLSNKTIYQSCFISRTCGF